MAGTAYKAIIDAAEEILKSAGSKGPESAKSNKQIVGAIREKIANGTLNIEATDGTMISYLSYAANNDPDSAIVSGGLGRGGYWYDESKKTSPRAKAPEQEEISIEKGKSTKVQEKDLYPLLELWLEQKGYKSKDLSNLKGGGRWGNPDIIGVERVELFGAVQIDLASCEVKIGENNWEQVIFEAISHKRFSNRSWFCYRVIEEASPLPKGMEYYAERYRVGVVQVILGDRELLDLKAGKKLPLDYFERVEERVPALYDYVPLREQRDLIERSGISLTLTF
jgi:hypothetical protein